MITLMIIFFIWFCISVYRINKASKKVGDKFDYTSATFIDSLVFILGSVALLTTVVMLISALIIKYLP